MFQFKQLLISLLVHLQENIIFKPENVVGVCIFPMVHICYADLKYHLKIYAYFKQGVIYTAQ